MLKCLGLIKRNGYRYERIKNDNLNNAFGVVLFYYFLVVYITYRHSVELDIL